MFDRFKKLINTEQFNKITNTNILIIGIGGVGSYVLESLVRSGINNITIIDNDVIEESNINRQLYALNSTINKDKVLVAKKRCLDINPSINIKTYKTFLLDSNINILDDMNVSYIVDCCDTMTTKLALLKYANLHNIKIVTCMGTGNRFDPTKLKITNIKNTNNDPVAKVMRKLMKDNNISLNNLCLCSDEIPVKTGDRTPGSTAFVPASAGLIIASYIINDIIKE